MKVAAVTRDKDRLIDELREKNKLLFEEKTELVEQNRLLERQNTNLQSEVDQLNKLTGQLRE